VKIAFRFFTSSFVAKSSFISVFVKLGKNLFVLFFD
jgi:hypothetical protein